MKTQLTSASVRVLRSHDYCHFEVTLSASLDCPPGSAEWFGSVDDLRKNAARLADKAVEQYKIAKREFSRSEIQFSELEYKADRASNTPEDERSPEQKAAIKALADWRFNERRYDYQDGWEEGL